jgi:hypothetical protein
MSRGGHKVQSGGARGGEGAEIRADGSAGRWGIRMTLVGIGKYT